MDAQDIRIVPFSPTGTTKRVLEAIAEGAGATTFAVTDLTRPQAAREAPLLLVDGLVIFGAPVYAGRLPKVAAERITRVHGHNTPAIIVVVYGNRAYEDALLELSDIVKGNGFIPIAAAAFIGEHSYATAQFPTAMGRPDSEDLSVAFNFGKTVAERLDSYTTNGNLPVINIPGNWPYRQGWSAEGLAPATREELCTLCGLCGFVCPTGAIIVTSKVVTDADACIQCCACVKVCPTQARVMDHERIQQISAWLWQNYGKRGEPELFTP